ncbi:MAG: N-6 DNA methylase [Bacteroidales bacterium]|nr:N-6 DNA methylase [Bacteroidales bacterium]MBD5223690.1 N-6 DNA methylase [Bacteroidales bacterium]
MNPNTLNTLIKQYCADDIEKSLVLHFIEVNNINVESSEYLSEYLACYTRNPILYSEVLNMGNYSLEELSVAFELLIPPSDRMLNGAFFTPAYIVDYIIDNVAPTCSESIADVSCGCGAFLLGILRYYIKKFNRPVSEILRKNLRGADILDYNVRRAKLLIILFALMNQENISPDDIHIICCDSLRYNWNQKFDCIVGNPPYVKFQDMTDDSRAFLADNWATTSFGTFNLYFAFFELGYNLLSDTGRLGYITPNNFFTSLAGESLRTYFQQHQCVYKIVDFNATKVFDVQTYTAISFLNKHKNDSIEYGRIKDNQTPFDFLNVIFFSSNPYEGLNAKKWRLLCGEARFIINQIESIGDPIGQLFNICVGIATLKDEVYSFFPVSSDDTYFYFVRDNITWKVEKQLTRSTVKISEMKCQADISSNERHFIFPYKMVNGKMVPIPEEEMAIKYPACYAYFTHVKEILASRGKGKHVYIPFYSYGRTQGLNRKGVKLYTPTFSKTPRFLIDLDEDSLFTNGYGIYFRETSKNLFDTNPITEQNNLDVIQKILNSNIMNYYISATSVAIEGGYPCYQKNFIEKFTIPNLDESEIDHIRSISDEDELNAYLEKIYQINLPLPNLCS